MFLAQMAFHSASIALSTAGSSCLLYLTSTSLSSAIFSFASLGPSAGSLRSTESIDDWKAPSHLSMAALAASANCCRRKLSLPLLASFSSAASIVRPTLTGIFGKSTYFDFSALERSRSRMVVSAMGLFPSSSGARIAAWSGVGWEGSNPQQGGMDLRLALTFERADWVQSST